MAEGQLDRLLDELQTAIEASDDRVRCAAANNAVSASIAACLPLIHRTGKRGSSAVAAILSDGALRAESTKTIAERRRGEEKAVYLFLGYPAYPKGQIAFLFRQRSVSSKASFSPFDSGALAAGFLHLHGEPVESEAAQAELLMRYSGQKEDLELYTSRYLSAHFWKPIDYLQSARHTPDFTAYHNLESPSGDRRAWTIEVRIHEDLYIGSLSTHEVEIAIDHEDLLEEFPDLYIKLAVVRSERTSFVDWLSRRISSALEKQCTGL